VTVLFYNCLPVYLYACLPLRLPACLSVILPACEPSLRFANSACRLGQIPNHNVRKGSLGLLTCLLGVYPHGPGCNALISTGSVRSLIWPRCPSGSFSGFGRLLGRSHFCPFSSLLPVYGLTLILNKVPFKTDFFCLAFKIVHLNCYPDPDRTTENYLWVCVEGVEGEAGAPLHRPSEGPAAGHQQSLCSGNR
jgi:hypothetical protein